MRTILYSILLAVALIVGYSLYCARNPTELAVPQSIAQDNTIKMQEYIYAGANRYATVIVGSSLSATMPAEALPADCYNLAFRGMSVFEGFEILKRSGQVPKQIFVEINTLDRRPNPRSVDALFNPIGHPLRKALAGTHDRNQPVNRLFAVGLTLMTKQNPERGQEIRKKLGARHTGRYVPDAQDLVEKPLSPSRQALRQKVLAELATDQATAPKEARMETNLSLLRKQAEYFMNRGTQVVFFEMPSSPPMCAGARMASIRADVRQELSDKRYTFLAAPECTQYQTTDGQHLSDASSLRFALQTSQAVQFLRTQQKGSL